MTVITGLPTVLGLLRIFFLVRSATSQTPGGLDWSSIAGFESYRNLRYCAADCLYKNCLSDPTCEARRGSIDARLNCTLFSCICQQNVIKSASATISQCVMTGCSARVDANAAWDTFTSYCYAFSPPLPTGWSASSFSFIATTSTAAPSGFGTFTTGSDGLITPVFPESTIATASINTAKSTITATSVAAPTHRGIGPTATKVVIGVWVPVAILTFINISFWGYLACRAYLTLRSSRLEGQE